MPRLKKSDPSGSDPRCVCRDSALRGNSSLAQPRRTALGNPQSLTTSPRDGSIRVRVHTQTWGMPKIKPRPLAQLIPLIPLLICAFGSIWIYPLEHCKRDILSFEPSRNAEVLKDSRLANTTARLLECPASLELEYRSDETDSPYGVMLVHKRGRFSVEEIIELTHGQNCSTEQMENFILIRCPRPSGNSHYAVTKKVVHPFSIHAAWERESTNWKYLSYVICEESVCCHWPYPPRDGWENVSEGKVKRSHQRVVLASDYMDNLWHASNVMNAWCELRTQPGVIFAGISLGIDFEPYVRLWLSHVGIPSERIIAIQDYESLSATEVSLVPRMRIDWSCLHHTLANPSPSPVSIVVIHRSTVRPVLRDIPKHLHDKLISEIQRAHPRYTVETFYGNETFEETRSLFGGAVAVVGPHGAAFVNVVFCSSRTIVFEYMTPQVTSRVQMLGGISFNLTWMPILLSSFDDENDVLRSVSVISDGIRVFGERGN